MPSEPSYPQIQYFLALESQINFQPCTKDQNKNKSEFSQTGKSILYQELSKIKTQTTERKRQCVIKFLRNQGELKDVQKQICHIQQQGHAIPILQVAIALSKYDKTLLKGFFNCKSVGMNEYEQSQLNQPDKYLKSDPILSLLSGSQTLKGFTQQKKDPSFVDYKKISPSKKNELIDFEKGKFKKGKVQRHIMIQYPKQLKQMKKQLYSLPYISRYRKTINIKDQFNLRPQGKLKVHSQIDNPQKTRINQLNSSIRSYEHKKRCSQSSVDLEQTLKKAFQNRMNSLQMTRRDVVLPNIKNRIRNKIHNDETSHHLDTIQYPNKLLCSTPLNLQKNRSLIYVDSQAMSQFNPEQNMEGLRSDKKRNSQFHKRPNHKYWPSYQQYSPYNNGHILTQVQRLKLKMKSFTELSEIPSEQTLQIYYSLKKTEQNDIKKLQNQSMKEGNQFSDAKYKIKYKNMKQNYTKRSKQFMKDRKNRQFQLQRNCSQQNSNMAEEKVKLNQKKLQKMTALKNY